MKRIKYLASAVFLAYLLTAAPVPVVQAVAPETPAPGKAVQEMGAGGASPEDPAASGLSAEERIARARKEIVARVEGTEITMYDLIGMMNRVVKAYYSHIEEATPEITLEIKKRALDRLIFETLAVRQAIAQGIKPEPQNVEKVLDKIKEAYGSTEAYQEYLDGMAVTEEQLRERIIRGQRLEIITGREVYGKVKVPEEAMQERYEKYQKEGRLKTADNYLVMEILVMEGASHEATKATAESLLARLNGFGGDFGKLVLDGTFIVREYPVRKEKNPAIYAKMDEMEVGELSGVFQDSQGTFHIFKVLEKEKSRDLTKEEAKGFIENELRLTFQEKRREDWMEELRKEAKIEILLEELKAD